MYQEDLIKQITDFTLIGVVIYGIVTNLICGIICIYSKLLRSYPSYIFIAFIVVSDCFAVIMYTLDTVWYYCFDYRLTDYSLLYVRLLYYISDAATGSTSWLLVILTIERYLTLKIKLWRKLYFNSKKALLLSAAIITLFFCSLIPLLLIEPEISYQNETLSITYYNAAPIQTLNMIHFLVSLLLPILILIVVNVLLIHQIMKTSKTIKRSEQATSQRRSISIAVVFVTCFYILMNSPLILNSVIAAARDESGINLILRFILLSKTVYHCSMFTLLMATNFVFRQETKSILMSLFGKSKDLSNSVT